MDPSIKPSTAASLRKYIDDATVGDNPTLPGVIMHVIDSQSNTLFSHTSRPHTLETTFQIHSVTKIIATIAFMQLVERGIVSLDDASIVEKVLPELASKKVVTGSTEKEGKKLWTFEERKTPITPRMLMNHTNGTGCSFFNVETLELLGEDRDKSHEGNEFWDAIRRVPLLWQPGTKTNYGQGLDWLGVLVERLTNRAFGDVLREGIFEKMGIKNTGYGGQFYGDMATSEDEDYWPTSFRTEGGLVPMEANVQEKRTSEDTWPKGKNNNKHVHTASFGLVSCVADLVRIASILLPQNAGVDRISGARIVSPESVAEIAKAQLPEHIRNNSRNLPNAHFAFCPAPLQADHLDPEGSFSLGCAIQGEQRVLKDGRRGRSKGTIYWYGAANIDYWIDGEKGIIVFVVGNYFPFAEQSWVDFIAGVEGLIYEGLE